MSKRYMYTAHEKKNMWQLAVCRPTVGRQSTDKWPTGFSYVVGQQSADRWPTVCDVSVGCR